MPVEAEAKPGIVLGKGKIPEEKVMEEKPLLKPPTLITPEEVVKRFARIFIFFYNLHWHTILN